MDEMTPEEVRSFVGHNKFGLLGLASHNKAYAVPLFYGYDGRKFYFATHPGVKDEFIQDTEEACFTMARVHNLEDWGSVEAFGKIEEVTADNERLAALDALMTVPLPPQFGTNPSGNPKRAENMDRIFKLTPTRMTGRKSTPPEPSVEEREIAFGGM